MASRITAPWNRKGNEVKGMMKNYGRIATNTTWNSIGCM